MTTTQTESITLPITIDEGTRLVHVDGQDPIQLTRYEFELMRYLAADPERVFKKTKILADVWDHKHTGHDSRTLDSHACRLRSKLPPGYVINVWGQGYRLARAGEGDGVTVTQHYGTPIDRQEQAERISRRARRLAAEADDLAIRLDQQRIYAIEAITAYEIGRTIRDAAERALIIADRVV